MHITQKNMQFTGINIQKICVNILAKEKNWLYTKSYKALSDKENIHKDLSRRANDEKDFVGWLELPTNYDKEEFKRIKKAAKKIGKESDILIVIGIGGSYLGARAVIESLTSTFCNLLTPKQRKYPQVLYVVNKYFRLNYGLNNQFLHAYKLVINIKDGGLSYLSKKEFVSPLPEPLSTIKKDIFG